MSPSPHRVGLGQATDLATSTRSVRQPGTDRDPAPVARGARRATAGTSRARVGEPGPFARARRAPPRTRPAGGSRRSRRASSSRRRSSRSSSWTTCSGPTASQRAGSGGDWCLQPSRRSARRIEQAPYRSSTIGPPRGRLTPAMKIVSTRRPLGAPSGGRPSLRGMTGQAAAALELAIGSRSDC